MNIPANITMIDGATSAAISNVFVNNNCASVTLQITGSFTTATVQVEGLVNLNSNSWVSLGAIELSDFELNSDGLSEKSLYQIGIEGIPRVRIHVTAVSGGDITVVCQFGAAIIDPSADVTPANLTPITAYDMAVAGGYTGTKAQFETDMGNSGTNATNAANSASAAAASAQSVAASAAQITQNANDISNLKTQIADNLTASEPPFLVLEQGGINDAGTLVDLQTRVRTKTKIYNTAYFKCAPGVNIMRVVYYNISNDAYNSRANVNANAATIEAVANTYYKLVFCKTDSTQNLTVAEIHPSGFIEGIDNRITALEHGDNDGLEIPFLVLENGGINDLGNLVDNANRVRTITKIFNTAFIKCKYGINISRVVYYNTSDDSYNSRQTINKNSATIEAISNTYYKIVFARADDTTPLSVEQMHPSMILENFNSRISAIETDYLKELDALILEQGGINDAGTFVDHNARVRTANALYKSVHISCPKNIKVFRVCYYNLNGTHNSNTSVNASDYTVPTVANTYYHIVFSHIDGTTAISPQDVKNILTLEELNSRVGNLETFPPMVKFSYDHDFKDLSSYTSVISGYNTAIGAGTAMDYIYELFDDLMTDYSGFVTRSEPSTTLSLSYPEYADYHTYMYKFSNYNANVNYSNLGKKKTLFIIAGLHGNEYAAPLNAYIFAKELCADFLADENFFKLRGAFDVYILPCLDGYGMINNSRLNGNDVNINRNFPIAKWAKAGEGTQEYTGASAGSEFETQLVIGITNSIKPDVFIDHHNYSSLTWQWYTLVSTKEQAKATYDALNDVSFTLKKELPDYFGTNFDFLTNRFDSTVAPASTLRDTDPMSTRWAYEYGIMWSSTIEVSSTINYSAGEPIAQSDPHPQYMNENVFMVDEYTLRNQILHYCEWMLAHDKIS